MTVSRQAARGRQAVCQLLLAVAIVLSSSWSAAPALTANEGQPVNWTTGEISAVGQGVFPPGHPAAQARLMARQAAKMDAERQLVEAVDGVQVTSNATVKNFELESDEVRTSLSGFLKGARVVEEGIGSDGAYQVRMALPLFGPGSLAGAVLGSSGLIPKLPLAESKESPLAESKPEAETPAPSALVPGPSCKISGLIVDARYLGAKACLMPAVFDPQGRELYLASLPVSNEDLVAEGPVSYVKSVDEARRHPRVGTAPLVITAKRYRGPFHSDLVLSEEDSAKLVVASRRSDFLRRLAVVVVL